MLRSNSKQSGESMYHTGNTVCLLTVGHKSEPRKTTEPIEMSVLTTHVHLLD